MLDVLMNILTSCRCLASPGTIYDAFHHKLDAIISKITPLVKLLYTTVNERLCERSEAISNHLRSQGIRKIHSFIIRMEIASSASPPRKDATYPTLYYALRGRFRGLLLVFLLYRVYLYWILREQDRFLLSLLHAKSRDARAPLLTLDLYFFR